ncbi:MAG TPA: hypothetical protein VFC92_00240 [Bacteroidales bacterium]|nr:hypothetical protein [Bacteroidales bacterium]
MNVHIIRTEDVDEQLVKKVLFVLNAVPGPVKYLKGKGYIDEDSLEPNLERIKKEEFNQICCEVLFMLCPKEMIPEKAKVVSWDKLFKACNMYREEYDIGDDEFVVLLTGLSNKNNWFSAFDTKLRRDAFIQTTLWDFYSPGNEVYPIVYEIAANVLQSRMFDSYDELLQKTHPEPIGCMNDINQDKRNITFKLRTGDICESCQQIIAEKKIDVMLVQQVFSIFNKIRSEMLYLQQFRMNLAPGKIIIDMMKKALLFPDYKEVMVKLTPLEMTVYLVLFRYENGLTFAEFTDHIAEMEELYKNLTASASLVELKKNIENLAWNNDGSLSQKISNINRKLAIGLGNDVSGFYKIQGAAGEPRVIPIDRKLVSVDE